MHQRQCPTTIRHTLLKLSPLALPFFVLFLGGLTLAVLQSFGLLLGFSLPDAATRGLFDAYATLFEPRFLRSMGLSFWVAGASASISVCLGVALAYGVWKLPHTLTRKALVYKVPLILPHIAVGFIVLILFSRSGFLSSVAYHLGFIEEQAAFPNVLYSGWGLGMITAYVYKETPFVVLLAHAVLRRLDPRLMDTARLLGASRMRTFQAVVLPHLKPVLHTAFIILFLYTFGAFEIPYLLGESNPGMLSMEVYDLYFRRDIANRPVAMALLVCMFLFSIVFIVLYTRVVARLEHRERKL